MGNDLHRAAQIVALTLFLQHPVIDLAGGEVVVLAHGGADETFVMPQVQIGLGAVAGDEDLAVLKRAHGARIDIDIGIEFDEGDFQPPGFQQSSQRSGGDAFSQRGNHTAGDEDESGHGGPYAEKKKGEGIAIGTGFDLSKNATLASIRQCVPRGWKD